MSRESGQRAPGAVSLLSAGSGHVHLPLPPGTPSGRGFSICATGRAAMRRGGGNSTRYLQAEVQSTGEAWTRELENLVLAEETVR